MTVLHTPQAILAAGALLTLLAAIALRFGGRRPKAARSTTPGCLVGREMLLRVLVIAEEPSPATMQGPPADDKPKLPDAAARPSKRRRPVRFVIDSIQLAASFRYVCGQNSKTADGSFREVFHYAAGVKVNDATYVITKFVPVSYARQSAVGVLVDNISNVGALGVIDTAGLILVAHFHSHPGFGRQANHPSNTDHSFQERLERGGHFAIGGIFSRDGYVRFFAGDLDRFVVDVIGNGIRKVGDNEFQVLELDVRQLSHDAFVGGV